MYLQWTRTQKLKLLRKWFSILKALKKVDFKIETFANLDEDSESDDDDNENYKVLFYYNVQNVI